MGNNYLSKGVFGKMVERLNVDFVIKLELHTEAKN